jgi:AmmeMemoRadiSam system protein B
MNRQPAVADRFYPGSHSALSKMITSLTPASSKNKEKAISLISPHAGYIYSGKLACETISSAEIPESVIIIGPNHHGLGARVAVSMSDWNMPQGIVPTDKPLAQALVTASPLITEDEKAHLHELSLEVQVPFLQTFQKNLKIIPIVISQLSYSDCEAVADAITANIKQSVKRPLLLASTDMSHYESRAAATSKDKQALDRIIDLDPHGLYQTIVKNNISMCGFIPVTITLMVSKQLGATSARLVNYTDSGETSGDLEQVVGYAGFVIS